MGAGVGGVAAEFALRASRSYAVRVSPQVYVNPSCSKCRTALSLLEEHHIEAEVVRYLDEPPSVDDLERLMTLLGIEDPRRMMRSGEPLYSELALDDRPPAELLEAITRHPILLERPIFVLGDRAVIARPPERLLELL
jgi:arsenate reductase